MVLARASSLLATSFWRCRAISHWSDLARAPGSRASLITWGLVSAAFALIGGPISFLVLRFLLGAAEAGFFPGVILYITYWYPAHYRAIIVGIFMVAIPIAGLIGSPISGAILYMDGIFGLGGWQWIFLLEALPTLLLGLLAFSYLTDKPEHATWLEPNQRHWLIAKL